MNSIGILKVVLGTTFIWMVLQSCLRDAKTIVAQQTAQKNVQPETGNNVRIFNDPIPADTDTAVVFPLQEVPVLCYHSIKMESERDDVYTVSETEFATQVKMLSDSGYHTVLPDQLYQYFTAGKPLPPKPIMLSFDDTRIEHFTVAAPEMGKYGFKGAFFIMNICIGKPGYMTAEQIKALSDNGHVIGCHTWDHHSVRVLHGKEWNVQIDQPKSKLEQITGKPAPYFAYPYGLWNDSAIYELKKRGIKAAFQLNGRQSKKEPLYTIRRMIVPGGWSPSKLNKFMTATYNM